MIKKILLLLMLSLPIMGCATKPTDPQELELYNAVNDPIEPFNRGVFAMNNFIDDNLLTPVARGYRFITPKFLRTGISNAFKNLKQPTYLANALMQGNGTASLDITKRFLANTFLGFGGLFDVASDMQIPANDFDFGQTLALWGWEDAGPFLMLPLYGPSTPRDSLGLAFASGMTMAEFLALNEPALEYAISGLDVVRIREQALDFTDSVQKSSTDYYTTLRAMYYQNRQKELDRVLKSDEEEKPLYDFEFNIEE